MRIRVTIHENIIFVKLEKQLRKSTKSRPTIERPKIKPIVEKLNSVMDADKNTLMSGSTNVVILFITNVPGDLHNVNKGQLTLIIDKSNRELEFC